MQKFYCLNFCLNAFSGGELAPHKPACSTVGPCSLQGCSSSGWVELSRKEVWDPPALPELSSFEGGQKHSSWQAGGSWGELEVRAGGWELLAPFCGAADQTCPSAFSPLLHCDYLHIWQMISFLPPPSLAPAWGRSLLPLEGAQPPWRLITPRALSYHRPAATPQDSLQPPRTIPPGVLLVLGSGVSPPGLFRQGSPNLTFPLRHPRELPKLWMLSPLHT